MFLLSRIHERWVATGQLVALQEMGIAIALALALDATLARRLQDAS